MSLWSAGKGRGRSKSVSSKEGPIVVSSVSCGDCEKQLTARSGAWTSCSKCFKVICFSCCQTAGGWRTCRLCSGVQRPGMRPAPFSRSASAMSYFSSSSGSRMS